MHVQSFIFFTIIRKHAHQNPAPAQWPGACSVTRGLKIDQTKVSKCEKRQLPHGHSKHPSQWLVIYSHTPNWDKVLRRAHSLVVHPPSCIPWQISRHFPSPRQVSMGQESIIAQYMHHTVVVQMRTTWMCIQSTQTLGVAAVVPSFQTGCVYHLEDLGLDPLDHDMPTCQSYRCCICPFYCQWIF